MCVLTVDPEIQFISSVASPEICDIERGRGRGIRRDQKRSEKGRKVHEKGRREKGGKGE